ncbi:PREDICTED: GLABROUS1 enhancer-binding protein-like 2 [Tarenaya hassleriana]|uniref:GLABROUS1 enhancer-binding protein-like 2 n=1 Tax=Tarenaya hassleriana TaxID=28532 RepID=UPI00053C3629|nr:PREDICTED: GLABROUS1 enhancer-binding protein-like 2 [Tarenaya hassleriana]
MPKSTPLSDNSPPISANDGNDAGDCLPVRSTVVSGKESAGSSKLRSKRSASDMIDGAKGKDEAETVRIKKKKKKKTKGLSSSSEAATGAAQEDVVFSPVAGSAGTTVADVEEGKKIPGGRIFTEEDDVLMLEAIIEYRVKTGTEPSSDPGAFYDFVKGSLHVEVSKTQVMDKIRSLQKKFRGMVGKYRHEQELAFTRHDSKVFDLSMQIWGVTDSIGEKPIGSDAPQMKHTVGTIDTTGKKPVTRRLQKQNAVEKHQEPGNAEDEDNYEENDRDVQVVGNGMDVAAEDRVEGKEGRHDDADDFWARFPFLKDGVETMLSEGVFLDFPRKLLLEKVVCFGGDKGKEWDAKWKDLRVEEMGLRIRKLDLMARFSQAALDELKK